MSEEPAPPAMRAKDGIRRESYPNGNPKSAGRVRNGKRHGPWRFWHRDGKLWSTGTFADGVGVGLFSWYGADGKLRQSGRFDERGRQTGLWKRWYGGTTQLFDVGRYEAGKRVGTWRTYAKDGRVKRETTFAARATAKPARRASAQGSSRKRGVGRA